MAIKSPPGLIPLSHLSGEELLAHLRFNRVTDEKGRYLPFDELQYRIKKGEKRRCGVDAYPSGAQRGDPTN